MKNLKVLATFLAIFVSAQAQAGSVSAYGYVTGFLTINNAFMFFASGARTGTPICQGKDVPTRWALDGSTAIGQSNISLILTAYSLHRRVTVLGTGGCSVWGDTETVLLIATDGY